MEGEGDDLHKYMLEFVDFILVDRKGISSEKVWKMYITKRGKTGKCGDNRSKNRKLYMKMDQRLLSRCFDNMNIGKG